VKLGLERELGYREGSWIIGLVRRLDRVYSCVHKLCTSSGYCAVIGKVPKHVACHKQDCTVNYGRV
jgi:hypothetical protein